MSALPPRQYRQFNKNFSAFNKDTPEATILELQKACQELQQAVTELQRLQTRSRIVEPSGLPTHGSRCELLDGQFLHLTQTVAGPTILVVEHGLGRVPQGAIFILTRSSEPLIFVAGDVSLNVAPATETKVLFRLNGALGDLHICILF